KIISLAFAAAFEFVCCSIWFAPLVIDDCFPVSRRRKRVVHRPVKTNCNSDEEAAAQTNAVSANG
ncbi:hypothetical protein, partial [Yersinia enterocolitica]|uniref:hypothetical protein n=1 Tax=Yersinia enterocolitica TaxID=630 RepID=UPI003BA78EC5